MSLMVCSLLSCKESDNRLSLGEQPVYQVMKSIDPMFVDGKMDEPIWAKAEVRSLDNFYRVEMPSDKQPSSIRMVWDDENLYVFYQIQDKYLTARETKPDGQPYNDDCVEFFIIPAPDSLDSHIGFEVNLFKATNDFIYFNNYYQKRNYVFKAFDPDHEVEVTYEGTINDNSDLDQGWTLELAIPFSTFRDLPGTLKNIEGSKWAIQAVRQDRNDAEGDRRSSATLFPVYDIKKSVHQANRFGLMKFIE
ncbi:MAG: carbohydrate-binding family 9-like protein [Reichenbachiella sp.]